MAGNVDVHRVFATDQAMDVLRFAGDALQQGQSCALITLVEIDGGSARALGAQMAVRADGGYCGTVSGGCVEAAAAREALLAFAEGCDRILHLGKGSGFFDIALPCGGGIKLAIHIIRQANMLEAVLDAHQHRRPLSLCYDPVRQQLEIAAVLMPTGWNSGCFYTHYDAALQILLYAQGLEGEMLQQACAALKIELHRVERPDEHRMIDHHTAIVVLHHDLDREIPVLHRALNSDAFYIGCLGSRRTHQRRVQQLLQDGVSAEQIERLAAPIGLFGPVRDANALAVSVLAQILASKPADNKLSANKPVQ